MHYVRLLLISFTILLLLFFGISLLIPQNVRIARVVTINAPKEKVLAQVRDAAQWKNWYPGLESTQPYLADGKLKGYIFDNSDPERPVYIAITGEKENEVNAEFVTRKLNPVINGWVVADGGAPGTTSLQWYMNVRLRWYPWEKFASLTLEKTYGPPMEQGLASIKNLMEN